MPFLEKKFPRLSQRYQKWYERAGYAPEKYRHEIAERVARLRRKYKLGTRPENKSSRGAPASPQLNLALGDPAFKVAPNATLNVTRAPWEPFAEGSNG
jgi:hypothetical protein